ncbi:LacI family DNA-binding transcriptional regulator [Paenibacillus thermoaerophilus]|uniref:LacI family DNA-binding transcriptional regulator n=1 Tax=Paenibacillus thermoaerophilus TaxID=1215385 RepID=A0ABW2V4N1_9BACL|nr:LacI family DNA-binding transcriptional regulator [Paenibacillus thermoaerophilus]
MNVTIADLAKMTGLAKSTISGVLNNKSGFSEKTRQKVLKAAEQYGYVPNEIARGLTSKFTKTIGLVIKDITNPFYNQITKGVQEIANAFGYTVFLCSSGEDHEAEINQIEAMVGRRVDGLIIAPLLEEVTFDHIYELKRKSLPFALLGKIPGLDCDWVEFDDYSGGRQAAEHLIENGHTQIGFITGLRTSRASKMRYSAFKDTLVANGLTLNPDYVFHEAQSFMDGVEIGQRVLQMDRRPTALICFDDVIAMGVIKALEQSGLKVPDDLSVIGFDDIDMMLFPLTTVSIPTYEAGKTLARILFERIFDGETREFKQKVFDVKLVTRNSVKRLHQS